MNWVRMPSCLSVREDVGVGTSNIFTVKMSQVINVTANKLYEEAFNNKYCCEHMLPK